MAKTDRELGMDRPITRRDFLNGVSLTVGGALVSPARFDALTRAGQQPAAPSAASDYYPPAKTGLRGSHPGSFEVAHGLRNGNKWGPGEDTGEVYDLVVVGGGMAGLSAAYYFKKAVGREREGPDSRQPRRLRRPRQAQRVHRRQPTADRLRRHASRSKRPTPTPWRRSAPARTIGIDGERFLKTTASDRASTGRWGSGRGVFFDKETSAPIVSSSGCRGSVARRSRAHGRAFLAKTPLSPAAQKDLLGSTKSRATTCRG